MPPPGTMPSSIGCASRVEGVLDASPSSLSSRFRWPRRLVMTATPPDQLGEALLELLTVVVAGRGLDLLALITWVTRPLIWSLSSGAAIDDGRVVLGP